MMIVMIFLAHITSFYLFNVYKSYVREPEWRFSSNFDPFLFDLTIRWPLYAVEIADDGRCEERLSCMICVSRLCIISG